MQFLYILKVIIKKEVYILTNINCSANCLYQKDGGINLQNIDLLKQAGVSNVVVGNALMKTKDKKDMINKLKN